MNRLKAASALRVIGYAAMCVPFLVMMIHRKPQSADFAVMVPAVAVGTGFVALSLRLRGYRRDARFLGMLGIVAVLGIVYAWGVSP